MSSAERSAYASFRHGWINQSCAERDFANPGVFEQLSRRNSVPVGCSCLPAIRLSGGEVIDRAIDGKPAKDVAPHSNLALSFELGAPITRLCNTLHRGLCA